ncbi:EAL domain-containing protein [Stappia sp.]|uniref:putative bifunctional diguanylate cyclase/phosphodiesterase n=1 Tax=Stappia sp. TaxID=1870903 RepID=UPI0032D91E00
MKSDRAGRAGSRTSNWPILAKVMAAPLVVLIALAALSFFAWQALSLQRQMIAEGYQRIEPILENAFEIPHSLARVEADLYKLSIWSQIDVRGAELERTLRSIRLNLKEADQGIAALSGSGLDGVDELRAAYDLYRKAADQAMELISRNPTLGAVATRGSQAIYAEAEAIAQDIAARASAEFSERTARTIAAADRMAFEFILISVLAGIAAIAISFATARRLVRPVRGLVRVIRLLLQGDLSVTVPFVERRDEFGRIAQSVQELQRLLLRNRELADAQEQRRAELEYHATHDALTGIANRKGFDGYLEAMEGSPNADALLYLLIDLDGFKPINDSHGHEAGDVALRTIARRLQKLVRRNDIVARIGGDEFGILVDTSDGAPDAETLAQRLLAAIESPISHNGRTLSVGASIGLVRRQDVEGDMSAFLAAADQAMYAAKQDPDTAYRIHRARTDQPTVVQRERAQIERALETGEFVLHYQPKIDLWTGRPTGYEALPRWQHPEDGLLLPSAFMPLLERHGLKTQFSLMVAQQIFADAARLAATDLPIVDLSFDLDEAVLASDRDVDALCDLVMVNLRHASRVTIEIPEDTLLTRASERIRTHVHTLHRHGLRICIDRVGAGHASIRNFRKFPFQEIKIDKSFIGPIGQDRSTEVIIEGFLAIATGLGADVIAEGIETEAQERYLQMRGCRTGQGYRYGPALPFDAMLDHLTAASAHEEAS